jgi:hypothetical protein
MSRRAMGERAYEQAEYRNWTGRRDSARHGDEVGANTQEPGEVHSGRLEDDKWKTVNVRRTDEG